MADKMKSKEAMMQEQKKLLIKTARMYAMCQKAEVAEPIDVAALALAAFEEQSLKRAITFVRSNSNSPEEFEQKIKEIKKLPAQEQKRPAAGNQR